MSLFKHGEKKAALRILRKLLKNQGVKTKRIVTDELGSYRADLKLLGLKDLQDAGDRKNNRAKCHTFQYESENENLRNSELCKLLKNYAQPTVKSTTSSIIDAISSLDQHSENSEPTLKSNRIWQRHQSPPKVQNAGKLVRHR